MAPDGRGSTTLERRLELPWLRGAAGSGVFARRGRSVGPRPPARLAPPVRARAKTCEHALSPARLAAWRGALKSQHVALALPRFTIDPASSLDLAAALATLGMADAFDPGTADFSKLARPATPRDRLAIGGVYHKAFVKVDETGTEAAAATAVEMMVGTGMPTEPALTITADRPFLFFIVDRQTGLVLFMGRVADPS